MTEPKEHKITILVEGQTKFNEIKGTYGEDVTVDTDEDGTIIRFSKGSIQCVVNWLRESATLVEESDKVKLYLPGQE